MNLISELKERAFLNGHNEGSQLEREYLYYKGILESKDVYSHHLRRASIDCMMFDNYSIEVDPRELLIGRFSNDYILTNEEEKIISEGKEFIKIAGDICGIRVASTGHRVIDYEKLLNIGIKGILSEIDEQLSKLDYSQPEDAEKNAVYTAMKLSLNSLCNFAKRAQDKLVDLYNEETDVIRKEEYRIMVQNFNRVPYEPCEHFYEALQCMWFVQFAHQLIGDITLTGRIDNYMYPFYKKDIEAGVITKEFAFELIENLYLKHNEIYGAWPASIMVGGMNRQGESVWNELSYMCIDAIGTTGLINPSVSVCYNEYMPEDLLLKCMDLISKGYTKPSIFNDKLIQEGLRDAGVSLEDSRYYIHSTCVEITPIGCSNIMVATPYINLNKSIEYILNGKKEIFGETCRVVPEVDFEIEDLTTFDKLYEIIKKVVSGIIRSHLINVCKDMYKASHYYSSPLASAFINNCISSGKDSSAGGAKYNFVYPCFPGFINLIDAITAIKYAVYDKKTISLKKLSDMCKNNFEGDERLHQYLLNKCPKFGNGIEEADNFGVDMYNFIRDELKKYKTTIGGTFHPSFFSWIMHGELGVKAAATPDGRKQGKSLSECLGSVHGMDKNGPIGVMRSIEKIDQKYGIGGIATNFRFSKKFMSTDEGKKAVADFTKVFMNNKCFEIQFNVVDQKVLLDALKHPENYKTLMVRVAGYSDYFVNLSPVIQEEIIRRSEYDGI